MGQFRVNISEEAQGLLETLVEVFDSTRSSIVEELIIDYIDDYANSRKDELDAWKRTRTRKRSSSRSRIRP